MKDEKRQSIACSNRFGQHLLKYVIEFLFSKPLVCMATKYFIIMLWSKCLCPHSNAKILILIPIVMVLRGGAFEWN